MEKLPAVGEEEQKEHLEIDRLPEYNAERWNEHETATMQGGATEHAYPDPDVIFSLDRCRRQSDDGRTGKKKRGPDLGAEITVTLPWCWKSNEGRQLRAMYRNHGQSKTAFLLRSYVQGDPLDGEIMKVTRNHDGEPAVLRTLYDMRKKLDGWALGPDVLHECKGFDGSRQYHCWMQDRCIALDEFASFEEADKGQCVLAAMCCIALAATVGLKMTDVHMGNFGVIVSDEKDRHTVVIIDAGSHAIKDPPKKAKVTAPGMHNLWKWAKANLNYDCACLKLHWNRNQTLLEAAKYLQWLWNLSPILTHQPRSVKEIELELARKRSTTLQAFILSNQEKAMALIGGAVCRGSWNQQLTAMCFRAGRELQLSLTPEQAEVIEELYERITQDTRKKTLRTRTPGEVKAIIDFWWHLQTWRTRWLLSQDREDGEDVELKYKEVQRVLWLWQDEELWSELTKAQKRKHNLTQIYNAILNNRAGWAAVGHAVIKWKMPELPEISPYVIEDAMTSRIFIERLTKWLSRFAQHLAEKWKSEAYKKARAESGCLESRQSFARASLMMLEGDGVLMESL